MLCDVNTRMKATSSGFPDFDTCPWLVPGGRPSPAYRRSARPSRLVPRSPCWVTGDVPTQPRSLKREGTLELTGSACITVCAFVEVTGQGERRQTWPSPGQPHADLQAVLEKRLACMRQDCLCHMCAAMPACRRRVRRVPCTRSLCACWRHTVLASLGSRGAVRFHAARVLREGAATSVGTHS